MTFNVVAADRSHAGHVRKVNEDAVVAAIPVFAVADGMGGHNSGDVASAIAATVLYGLGREGPHTQQGVQGALELANVRIRREIPQGSGGAGTTVVGVVLKPGGSFAFNVGDSRLYRCRDSVTDQLTKDHSVVQELVDSGEIGIEEAGRHEQRNVITRAVGIEPEVDIDLFPLEPQIGDRYLLASDGLSGEVSHEEISRLLASEGEPDASAEALIGSALANGGRDNISVIVIDVVDGSEGPTDDTVDREDLEEAKSGDTTERRKRLEAMIRTAEIPDGDPD